MSDPLIRKIPWRRKWQPPPVFLPGQSHAQRGLVGCSPRCCKESDRTQHSTAEQSKGEELVNSCRKESRQGGKELVMKGCVRGELCQGHFPLIESVFGKYSPLCIMKGWRNWLILRDHELMHMHANPACTSLCYVCLSFCFLWMCLHLIYITKCLHCNLFLI